MSNNGYMQWIWVHCAVIRSALIWVALAFTIVGAAASFTEYWHTAATAFSGAFLCKWLECWLLEKALKGFLEAEGHL